MYASLGAVFGPGLHMQGRCCDRVASERRSVEIPTGLASELSLQGGIYLFTRYIGITVLILLYIERLVTLSLALVINNKYKHIY